MVTLFVSDVHLTQSRPDITRAFLRFLDQHASKAEQLYILGDFFDFWIGDDYIDHAPKDELVQEVIAHLSRLSQQGLTLYFMHGNRDFLLGQAFMALCNAQLLPDPTVIFLDKIPTLLLHGDSLCTQDFDYIKFRTLARSEQWITQQLRKSIHERLAFAQQLRQDSKNKNTYTAENILDVCEDEVIRVMDAFQVNQMIHGHTHRPDIHNYHVNSKDKKRYVLGDWDHQGWFLQHDEHGLHLQTFTFA